MKRFEYLQPVNQRVWQGRIDDEVNYEAFRWHQWIQPIDLEDMSVPLKGKLNICFIGFACDQGVARNKGRIGASSGPDSIRRELANLPCQFNENVKLYDVGTLVAKHMTLEDAQASLAGLVERIISLNMFPIVLGGGHEIAYGHYNGLVRGLKDRTLGIVNFDAHLDIRPYPNGGSSGTMFRQIYDDCQVCGREYGYLCLGVQKRSNTILLFKDSKKMGAEYVLAKDIAKSLPENVIDRYSDSFDKIYLTICSDVFAAAYAPGVSAPQTLGLEPEKVLQMVKRFIRTGKVISFDIAEVSPRFDHDRVTSNLASVMIFAVVNTLAEIDNLLIDFE